MSAIAADAAASVPRLVMVGMSRTPAKSIQTAIALAAERGLQLGRDVHYVPYRDLKITGSMVLAHGSVLSSAAQPAQFWFRGGGNLRTTQMETIAAVQAAHGASLINDLGFIRAAGSKQATFDVALAARLPLPRTIKVDDVAQVRDAWQQIGSRDGVMVLKKASSLGGRDVHFIHAGDDAAAIVAASPGDRWVAQEYLAAARDQDIRVHMVLDVPTNSYRVQSAYVRNRAPDGLTPNLANGGFATAYTVSPWEHDVSIRMAEALAKRGSTRPVHIALDLFPRVPITEDTVVRNAQLWSLPRDVARSASRDTAVIGEAASSAGTKGTELVTGGDNPVVAAILDAIVARHSASVQSARSGASLLHA